MSGDTVECFNCGRANPTWAQVCRSCGVPISAGASRAARSGGPFPTDRESLISIGATLAAILGAIVFGMFLTGLIPDAPLNIDASATPQPSRTPRPSSSFGPSTPPVVGEPTPVPSVALPGTVAFGTGRNGSTGAITNPTDTFTPGANFCHSINLGEPFGVDAVEEEVLKIEEGGELTVVQERTALDVTPTSQTVSYCTAASNLINGWGVGQFLLRDYRPGAEPVLLAEGRFTLVR